MMLEYFDGPIYYEHKYDIFATKKKNQCCKNNILEMIFILKYRFTELCISVQN